MIDRLVCADGGSPDPTRTHGKDAEAAKELEPGRLGILDADEAIQREVRNAALTLLDEVRNVRGGQRLSPVASKSPST